MYEDKEIEEYIVNSKEEIEETRLIKSVIAIYIPSMKQLFKVLKECGIYIDSQSVELKKLIQESYYLENKKNVATDERIKIILDMLYTNCKVFCNDEDYQNGHIAEMLSDNLMLVKFNNRKLPVMCNSKSMLTVHDEVKRKITRI